MTTADVVVIGAGCAGLSAATALADAGARVVVVEARPVLGGRTFATVNHPTGDWVDNGQHVLFGCYHDTFAFLDRIGSSRRVHIQGPLAVRMVDGEGRATELRCPSLPSPLHLAAGVLAWDALSWRERLSVAGMAPALAADAPLPPPHETVRGWLERHGQSPRLCELLWEPLAVAALNEPIDQAAAAPFAEVVRRILGPGADDASMAWAADTLSDVFVAPAASFVEAHGGTVLAGRPASVTVVDDRVAGVCLRGGDEIRAGAVVSAVPWHAFPGLFATMPDVLAAVAASSARRSVAIVTVNLWFDRDVLGSAFVGFPGRCFQWAFDKARVTPGRGRHLSLVGSAADDLVELDNDALVALALRELRGAVPAAALATLEGATAVRERRATFSVAPGEPARPATVTALAGFFLAGDWTDTGLPATIESAVVSGHRAAAAVSRFLARPRPPSDAHGPR